MSVDPETIALAIFFKTRKKWLRSERWWLKRLYRFETWIPAKPTKPLNGFEADTGYAIVSLYRPHCDDVAMCRLYELRKPWKRCNTDSRKLFFRSTGWPII